jgi:hypothetical protein
MLLVAAAEYCTSREQRIDAAPNARLRSCGEIEIGLEPHCSTTATTAVSMQLLRSAGETVSG